MKRAYWIKRPGNGRVSYAVITPSGSTLRDERIDFLNQLLKAGASQLEIDRQVVELVRQLNADAKPESPFKDCHQDNLALRDEYWKMEYGRRFRKDERSARNRLDRAIRAVGRLSLLSAPIDQLQSAINRLPAEQQKPRAAALNQLLRWARRPERLFFQRPEEPEPRSITLSQLDDLCRCTNVERAHLFRVAFATGARAGELFAPWFGPFEQGGHTYVRITKQFKAGKLVGRKWGKQATPRVVPELSDCVRVWKPMHDLFSTERSRWVQTAAAKAGLGELTFHNFRHSYARYWSEKGVELTKLSLWLGDNYAVVEKYYRGWQLNVA